MKRFNRHMSLVAVAVVSLIGSPLAAQSAREGSPPADVKRDGAQATEILATEAAARLGVSRAEATVDAKAPLESSIRWIIIIALAITLAAVLAMGLALSGRL